MPIQEKCRVTGHKKVGPKHYKLSFFSSYISSQALPGQFVNLKCGNDFAPLLRRPISIHRISKEEKTFELLYEVIGKGTELLSNCPINDELDVLGPLGNGFKIDPEKKIMVLVGGGLGIAPLLALAEKIKKEGKIALYILIGAKTKELVLCEETFKNITDQVLVSTDDGTYGKKGCISDILLNFIENGISTSDLSITNIYACGPKGMLKGIAEIAFQKKIDCQISMEEKIACGIGACQGCAIKTKSGYKMVCKDGPVFEAGEIVWQTLTRK